MKNAFTDTAHIALSSLGGAAKGAILGGVAWALLYAFVLPASAGLPAFLAIAGAGAALSALYNGYQALRDNKGLNDAEDDRKLGMSGGRGQSQTPTYGQTENNLNRRPLYAELYRQRHDFGGGHHHR